MAEIYKELIANVPENIAKASEEPQEKTEDNYLLEQLKRVQNQLEKRLKRKQLEKKQDQKNHQDHTNLNQKKVLNYQLHS